MKRSGSDGVAGHFFLTAKSRFHAGFSVMLKCLLAFGSVSTAFELAAAAKKADLWLDHPHYKLPGASSKGHSFAAAMGKSKNKTWLSSIDPTKYPLPGKRPVPTADFMAKDMPGKKGNVKFQKVRVELLEEAGVFRDAAVSFGFPLPQGALFDLAQIRLTDGKNPLDASFSITGKYADNSIRWVMIRTRMPLAAKEKKYVFVEFGSSLAPRKNLAKPVTVQTKGDNFIINNGAISAAINQKRFTFVNNIAAKGRYLGGVNAFGALLILKDGKRMGSYKLVPRSVKLIESTPQIVTFRIDGDFWDVKQPFASYSARISFRQGVPGFDVEYSFVNTNLRYEFLDIKSLTIGFCTGKPARNKIVS